MRVGLATLVLGILSAVGIDRAIAASVVREERARTKGELQMLAGQLRVAVDRRVALLVGLRSFVESRPDRRTLDAEFPLFAAGLHSSTTGVRALQLVNNGIIVATYPREGNERLLGYDLYSDPRPILGNDYRRLLENRRITVTGPIALVQGGEGIIIRDLVAVRAGMPEAVAIVLDVPALVEETGVRKGLSHLALELRARDGNPFHQLGAAPIEPEVVDIEVPDGGWRLAGAPMGGWGVAPDRRLRLARVASAIIVALSVLLAMAIAERSEQLSRSAEESGLRLDLASRAGPMGAFEWDVEHDRTIWSPAVAEIFGLPWPVPPLTGADFIDRVHAEDRPMVSGLVEELFAGQRTDYLAEYRVQRPSGEFRWILGVGKLQRSPEGRPLRLVGIVADSTERRALTQRVQHGQRLEAIGTLAGGVAHDFNNLLAAIVGFAELAAERAAALSGPDAESVRGDLAQILRVADRASHLTSQLLAFSRGGTSSPQSLEVGLVLRDLEPMLRRLTGGQIDLRLELQPALPSIWMDPGQLTQVVLNLVVNSRDAMPTGGVLTIRAGRPDPTTANAATALPTGEWVMIEVVDTGVGMSAEVQSRVFEPYFTTKGAGNGTGLGLAVVYGAVKGVGGHVSLESVEGRGTTVRVFLPAQRRAPEPRSES